MPQYAYRATDRDGQTVRGEVSADNLSAAIAELDARGLIAESITLPSETGLDSRQPQATTAGRFESPALDERFDEVIQRRRELIPALEALATELPTSTAGREIRQLVRGLQTAQTGADLRTNKQAMRWLPLLATGLTEQPRSRRLGDLIALASRESRNRSERRRLLAYPLIVLLITLLVFALLCAVVVPTYASMFREFGLRLPAPTRLVVAISDQITEHFLSATITVVVVTVAIYGLMRLWVQFSLTTRLLGPLTAGNSSSISAISSLAGQLAELLSIGVSVPDALWIAGQGCRHFYFKRVAENLARHAHDSASPLSDCYASNKVPANLIYALQAGPDGGPSIALLRELAALYGDRASQRIDWLTGAIAQFAILILGVAVGFLVLALFSPMLSLITGLS